MNITSDEVQGTIQKIVALTPGSELNRFFIGSDYVNYLNLDRTIIVIRHLQKHTSNPSWFEVLAPLINSNPDEWLEWQRKLQYVGFNENFIALLSYQDFRPKFELEKLLSIYLVDPQYYTHRIVNPSLPGFPRILNLKEQIFDQLSLNVNRYQFGDNGKYFQANYLDYCGIYYYYEESSVYYINLGKTLVTFNKITAALDLGVIPERIFQARQQIDQDVNAKFMNLTGGRLGVSFKEWLEKLMQRNYGAMVDPNNTFDNLYGYEDFLDQGICEIGRKAGLEAIVLLRMVSKTGYVTELLDLRSRRNSIKSLRFPPPLNIPKLIQVDPEIVYSTTVISGAMQDLFSPEQFYRIERVKYGRFLPRYDPLIPSDVMPEVLTIMSPNVNTLTGAIRLTKINDLFYIIKCILIGTISLTIDFSLPVADYLVLGAINFGNCSSYQIQVKETRGTQKNYRLITAYSNKTYYGYYEFLYIPSNYETLIVDNRGFNRNLPIHPKKIIFDHGGIFYLKELLQTFSQIKLFDYYEAPRVTAADLPNQIYYNVLSFVPITIDLVREVDRIFPNLTQIEIWDNQLAIDRLGLVTSAKLIPLEA